ncbi:Ig-like domain-containing protein, partial [Duffyella gerundensis]|uniref:Ig-like domain-containing protein n=2 Tax=Duffyella TaxID=3026546 RepID=UPI003F6E33B6
RATDSAGNEGTLKLYNLVISTTPPEPPKLIQLYDDAGGKTGSFDAGVPTDDRRPTLTGLAKPGSIVVLMRDGEEIGSAVADPVTGLWTLEPNVDLQDGQNSLTLVTRDTFAKKDRESEESEPFIIVVGPDAADNGGIALITHGWDDSGENVGELSTGALTSDTTPQLFGSAPASSTVRVQYRGENGSWTDGGTVTANADGEWNWTAPVLGAGNWEFRSSAATSGGWSDEFALEISDQAQAEVTITHGWDSEGAYTGELRSGALTDDNKPQLFGRAEANSLVYVHTRLENGVWERIGSAHAGPDGRWTLETERLSAGHNQLTAGNSPAASGDVLFELEVVTTDPAAPQIVGAYDDAGIITGYMGNPDVTDDRTPRLEGRAPTGAVVVIYQDGAPVGSVVAAGGVWQYEVPALTEYKTYRFNSAIRSGGTDGPQSAPWEIELITGNPTDVTLEIISMTADSGASATDFITNDGSAGRTLSGILSRSLASGERVLVSNGTQRLEAVVNGLTWTLVDPNAHAGSWEYRAWVENTVTGINGEQVQQTVTFDNSIVRATIDSIYDSASGKDLDAGATTFDRTPTLSGKAKAGSLVTVYDGEIPLGSTYANNNGSWSWEPSYNLTEKNYDFIAKATDIAGNASQSLSWDINVDSRPNLGFEGLEGPKEYFTDGMIMNFSSGLKMTVLAKGIGIISDHLYSKFYEIPRSNGNYGIFVVPSTQLKFELPAPSNSISFNVRHSHDIRTVAKIYDMHGKLIDTIALFTLGTVQTFTYTAASPDKKVAYVIIEGAPTESNGPDAGWVLDSISWDNTPAERGTNNESEVNKSTDIDEESESVINALNSAKSDEENKGQIDLTGEENNQITLNLNDLLTSGEKNLFIENGKTQLLITGDENDTVQLDDLLPDGTDSGDWIAQNGTVTVAGVEYQVFSHSGEEVEVLIQQGIKTELI